MEALAKQKKMIEAMPDGEVKVVAERAWHREEQAMANKGWGEYVGLKKLFTKANKKDALTKEEKEKALEKRRKIEAKNKVVSLIDSKRGLKGGILLSGFKGHPISDPPLS